MRNIPITKMKKNGEFHMRAYVLIKKRGADSQGGTAVYFFCAQTLYLAEIPVK